MFFKCIEVGDVVTNCYIFGNKEVVIIDPGDDATKIESIIVENDLIPRAILLTHGHFDHFLGCCYLKQRFKLPVYAHHEEKEVLLNPVYNLSYLIGSEIKITCDGYFENGDVFEFADFSLKVLHTPGHTPGSSCFLSDNILFSGDTLFKDSYGRSDLPLGNQDMIYRSIKEKLLTLPRNTKVYPGHGVPTTIGDELKNF